MASGYVDLHSHVLADIDDGAKGVDMGLTMLMGLAELGFTEVFATPHQRAGMFLPSADEIRSAREDLEAARAAKGVAVTLRLAAENMWDDVFHGRIATRQIPSYDGGPAFLFELPVAALPARLDQTIYELRMAGLLPVLAHPERYMPLWEDFDRAIDLSQSCAMVVDLAALDGAHGRPQAKLARRLVEDNVAHAVASDCHNPKDVKLAAAGIAWIKKRMGDAAVARLLQDGPREIVAGRIPV